MKGCDYFSLLPLVGDGTHIVQQAHRCVTWPCSVLIWMSFLSTKQDKVHLPRVATQWEGGARQPWSGNGFTLTDNAGYTQGCPEHTTFPYFHTHMYIIYFAHLSRELISVPLPALCDVHCTLFLPPHDKSHSDQKCRCLTTRTKFTSHVTTHTHKKKNSSSHMILAKLTIYSREEEGEAYAG